MQRSERSIQEVATRAFRDEHGVALPVALFALVILSGFLVAFLSMSGMEPQISRNLSDATGARYMAEAGIEWAFDQLVTLPPGVADYGTYWNQQLRGPDNIAGTPDDGRLATAMTLPGLPATSGTFTVTIRNDNQPGDNLITGQAVDTGGNADDQNGVVILTSTGSYSGVTRQIQVVLMRLNVNIPGGLDLPGLGTNTIFSGNSFTITGNDTNLDDTPGSCASVWGVGVPDSVTEGAVQASLSQQQKDNVTGKPQTAGPGIGDNTIAPDPSLTPAQIAKFVQAVKPFADISLQATGSNHLSYTGLGSTCATNLNDPACWGTRSNPKIIYVKGSLDPTQAFYAVSVGGTSTGAGILIIEDGDLSITGSFRWEGLILITGQYVGLRYGGGGNQTIYGAAVVNETAAANSEVEVDASGNAKLLYSCQALNNVRKMRKLFRMTSWREL